MFQPEGTHPAFASIRKTLSCTQTYHTRFHWYISNTNFLGAPYVPFLIQHYLSVECGSKRLYLELSCCFGNQTSEISSLELQVIVRLHYDITAPSPRFYGVYSLCNLFPKVVPELVMKVAGGILLLLLPYVASTNITQYRSGLPRCGLDCLSACIPGDGNTLLETSCLCADTSLSDNSNFCVNQNCTRRDSWEVTKLTNQLCSRERNSRQPQLLSTVAFGALASISVNARLWLRWKAEGRFNKDDWVMVVVNFFLLIFGTLGALCVAKGFGLDAWDVDNLPLALGLYFWDEIIYVLILGLCKISIITFYLRIFPSQKFRITSYFILAWVILTTVLFMLLALLQCIPISLNYYGWETNGGREKCLNLNAESYASAAINITQDFIILLLPIPSLIRLRVSRKKKIHVLFMFSLGFFICVCSIVRIFKVGKFTDDSRNPTRDFVDVTYWTAIETYVSVVVPVSRRIRARFSHA
ncbi:hypothetical protein BKA61DRAFT_303738 [Leptodontidium sp. MPI-SDFR-AT-0119]|nr:hypothetical protein BKA61DRAFT_303738 [Leptodontidium sp. MPI-SDFR-AT-0119]